jgi:sulfoxide reductase catalytic subunit YedY
MRIRRSPDLRHSDVTPKPLYLNRRNFLRAAGITGAAAAFGPRLWNWTNPTQQVYASTKLTTTKGPFSTTEKITPYNDVTHYNNFYEFGTDKSDPAKNAQGLRTSPWTVSVEGEVSKPRQFTMDEIMALAPLEERIYRHRCVEGWSIVIPWVGYSFNVLAKTVQPTSNARYVAFESFYDPQQMPLAKSAGIPFPYLEGLRIDEAMHPLAMLCVGMYGETLPNQEGAPLRLALPWKWGYKSAKMIVKIRFVKDQPTTTWSTVAPQVYGFYSNVNPHVDERYSQDKERRLGEFAKRETLMFNGYADQVASLYNGMDLKKFY